MTVTSIDRLPTLANGDAPADAKWQPNPDQEYAPEFQTLRSDLKPLNVMYVPVLPLLVKANGQTTRGSVLQNHGRRDYRMAEVEVCAQL